MRPLDRPGGSPTRRIMAVVLLGLLSACSAGGARTEPTVSPAAGTAPPVGTSPTPTTSPPTTSTRPEGPLLVLRGALIDGSGAGPMTDAVVVIDGDTIRAAGDRNTVSIPPGSEVIDLPGATILPGFINTHVHNAYELVNLQRWAREGVTTVRDLGARWDGSKDYFFLAGYYTDHVAKAARLIPAGPLVTVSDGYPIAGARFPSLAVTSPADAREQIEGLIADGARVIKITITVGGPPTLSLDQAAAIVDTAHGRGVPVSAHVTDVASLRRALDAGVDDIAHSITDRMPEELIARMIDQDVSWVPTLAIQQGAGADNLMRFVEAGGRVALGNDAGYLSGVVIGMPVNEIRAMAEAGLTPEQIIVAATRDAAYVCRLDNGLGTIEAGKLADILVVAGDPLEDLSALEDVVMVVRGGEIIRRET